MSSWTVEDEEKYIIDVLKRYDPKVVSLVERCHHARLYPIGDHHGDSTLDKDKLLAQGPLFVVKRHGRSIYNLMLMNRKAATDPTKETLNVWTAGVPLGPAAKLEMKGANMFVHCARTERDYRLHFTEAVDAQRMTDFCKSCTASNIGDLRSLLSMSGGSGVLTRSLDESDDTIKVPSVTMEWEWLENKEERPWSVPDLMSRTSAAPVSVSAATASTVQEATTATPSGKKEKQKGHKTHWSKHSHHAK